MKKKLLFALLAFALSLVMSVSVSAGTITSVNGSDSAVAKATYVPAPDTYKVDITWGALTYTYTQTWHTDTRTNSYAWASTAAGTADKISLSNSSNVGVKATLKWTADTTVSGVTGTFANSTLTMAKPNEGSAATTASTTLTLSGTPSSTNLNGTTVGTVTITIEKQS